MHRGDRITPGSAFAPENVSTRQHFVENHPLWLNDHEMSKVFVQ
jgi:hypothetical protein